MKLHVLMMKLQHTSVSRRQWRENLLIKWKPIMPGHAYTINWELHKSHKFE